MAQANFQLIEALRETANRLRKGATYHWGHHGACNCGNLLQVVGNYTKDEILEHAHTGAGEWSEMVEESCSISNAPAYLMISKLEKVGLTPTDIHHIEYLSDRKVLEYLNGGFRWLKRNERNDVIDYFEALANMLEEQLANQVKFKYEDLFAATTATL
jgi:hypothetical protein